MFQIQYLKAGEFVTIPIIYQVFEDAKCDAYKYKPGVEKRVIEMGTEAVMYKIPSRSAPSFLNV